MLKSLGVAGDSDSGVTLVESLDELVSEIVDDLYLARFGNDSDAPRLSYRDAQKLASQVVRNPATELRPLEADPDSLTAECLSFARDVLAELEIRKRRRGVLGYDDLLTRLADALADPDSAARVRMPQRWPVVMVDEFQDTDPVQWQVIERAFAGQSTLILIGDPKQAIYAFRGGDIDTYLRAAETAGDKQTLGINWRSDAALVDRLQVVLGGARTRRSRHRRTRGVRASSGPPPVRCTAQRSVPVAGGDPQRQGHPDHRDRPPPRAHRPRPGRRYRRAAGRRRHLRGPAAGGPRYRRHRGNPQGRPGLRHRARRGRYPRGVHRGFECVRLGRRAGLAVPAGGVRAAAPPRPGPGGGVDGVLPRNRGKPCRRR